MSNGFIYPVTTEEYAQVRDLDDTVYVLKALEVTPVNTPEKTDEELRAELAAKFGEEAVSQMMYPSRWYTKEGQEDVHRTVSELHTLIDMMEPECKPKSHTRTDIVGDQVVVTFQLTWKDIQTFSEEELAAMRAKKLDAYLEQNGLGQTGDLERVLAEIMAAANRTEGDDRGTGFYL